MLIVDSPPEIHKFMRIRNFSWKIEVMAHSLLLPICTIYNSSIPEQNQKLRKGSRRILMALCLPSTCRTHPGVCRICSFERTSRYFNDICYQPLSSSSLYQTGNDVIKYKTSAECVLYISLLQLYFNVHLNNPNTDNEFDGKRELS